MEAVGEFYIVILGTAVWAGPYRSRGRVDVAEVAESGLRSVSRHRQPWRTTTPAHLAMRVSLLKPRNPPVETNHTSPTDVPIRP